MMEIDEFAPFVKIICHWAVAVDPVQLLVKVA